MSATELPPTDRSTYRLIGEGAANVVFKIETDEQRGAAGYLLRLPKSNTSAYPYATLQSYWETSLTPLFPSASLVHQYLIPLSPTGDLIPRLNAVLASADPSRRSDFRGSRISPTTTTGMLVEDMAKKHPSDVVFEFKPKWLAQSPSAPAGSIRCRNCAREVQKRVEKQGHADKPIDCPLDLLACREDEASMEQAMKSLVPGLEKGSRDWERLAEWLRGNELLPGLRELQTGLDPLGPLEADPRDEKFQLAMTLRDCSVFVRIPGEEGAEVEAKVADLDKKNWEAKLEYWRATERGLIEEGYYEGRVGGEGTNCLLERRR